ncbi:MULTISPECIES: hypothetical protein [Streptomyces]|uniref:Secreted protein n=1 Tax=Streptomyces liliifuscus TaxID=2797636 RepID=A0A7T7HZM6_9ACTN|nr:hypothetical protein [Streptomyces liliifuscus]QQM38305.1 hypothetical protein JEQ17_01620 [Streptomyces liliifuscus]
MNIRKSATACLAAALLASGALAAAPAAQAQPADATGALSCYGSAKSFSKPAGDLFYPAAGHLTATSNCSDINIKSTYNVYVAACFLPTSGGEYCQSNWTYAPGGQWTVVATSVVDGTRFYFAFRSAAAHSGVWAA